MSSSYNANQPFSPRCQLPFLPPQGENEGSPEEKQILKNNLVHILKVCSLHTNAIPGDGLAHLASTSGPTQSDRKVTFL